MSFFSKIILLVIFASCLLFAKDVATITGLNAEASVDRDGQNASALNRSGNFDVSTQQELY